MTPKKKPLQQSLKRLEISRVVAVQAKAIASSGVRQYHEASAWTADPVNRATVKLKEGNRPTMEAWTIAERCYACQLESPFLLDQ
jgi:hypothetical protein